MACRKMNEDVAYARNTESGCKYSSEDIEEQGSDSEEEDEIGNLESPSGESRRTNTSWCFCDQCALMPTAKECVCCKGLAFLSKIVEGWFQF